MPVSEAGDYRSGRLLFATRTANADGSAGKHAVPLSWFLCYGTAGIARMLYNSWEQSDMAGQRYATELRGAAAALQSSPSLPT